MECTAATQGMGGQYVALSSCPLLLSASTDIYRGGCLGRWVFMLVDDGARMPMPAMRHKPVRWLVEAGGCRPGLAAIRVREPGRTDLGAWKPASKRGNLPRHAGLTGDAGADAVEAS